MPAFPPHVANMPDNHPLKRAWIAAGSPAPAPRPPSAEQRLAAAAEVLAEVDVLEAPVLPADVQDILSRAAQALTAS